MTKDNEIQRKTSDKLDEAFKILLNADVKDVSIRASSPIVGGDVKEAEPNLARIWKLIKQTAVQDYDPASKLNGLLFKNHKTGDFAFVSDGDVKSIDRALTAPALDAGKVPEGYKLVPIETLNELKASINGDYYQGERWEIKTIEELLSASPATSDDRAQPPHNGVGITGETSDGYHTFNELYEHRHILFFAVLSANPEKSWKSKLHDDGTLLDGWFIAGIKTDLGQATYHLPLRMWGLFANIAEVERAPKWDGHTSEDVLVRIRGMSLSHPKQSEGVGDSVDYLDMAIEYASKEMQIAVSDKRLAHINLMELGILIRASKLYRAAQPNAVDGELLEALEYTENMGGLGIDEKVDNIILKAAKTQSGQKGGE